MKEVEKFDYEELAVLIPLMKRASKKYIENELDSLEVDGVEEGKVVESLKEKIKNMNESGIRKLFDELPTEAY